MATDEQLNALREVALNLYAGQPPVSGYYRTKLKVHKDLLQSLSDCTVDNTVVKNQLKKHTQIIPLILKPYDGDGRGVPADQDRMKRNERGETHDQGVNTEENDRRGGEAPSTKCPPQTTTHSLEWMSTTSQNPLNQSGSGLTYGAKRKLTSPPGLRSPKRRRKNSWLKF